MAEQQVLRGHTRCGAAGEGGRNGHCGTAGGPRGIARREAGVGFAALLLFHHSSAANGRDYCGCWMLFPKALGVEARKRCFLGFFLSKRRWVSGPGWGCTGAETSWLFLISLTLPGPRSEREPKESVPERDYVCNLLAFLPQVVKALVFKTILSPSPRPCQAPLQLDAAGVEAGSLLPPPVWTWIISGESPFLFYSVVLFLGQHRNFFAHESHINSANNIREKGE